MNLNEMETQYYHAVSKKIKELRALKGYTQEFVATVLEKKSYSNYQKIESGKTNLSILDAKKLAELYDIDVIEIINPEQSKGDKIFMNKNCNNYESKVKLNISIELDGSIENLEKSMEILKKINGLL